MKLDGELAFCHSSTGLEPESQSFKLNDDNVDSTGCNLGNQKVKENENRIFTDLKRKEGPIDPLQNDMKGQNEFPVSKIDHHVSKIDLKDGTEGHAKESVEPVDSSSQDMGSIKKSSHVPIPDPQQDIESFKNSSDIYMDESVTECEPELVVCYKKSSDHDIKDICIDEGVPAKDKILFENNIDEKNGYEFLPSESCVYKESMRDSIRINMSFTGVSDLPSTEELDKFSDEHFQSKDLVQKDENAAKEPFDNAYKEMVFTQDKALLQELDAEMSRPSIDNGDEIEHDFGQVSAEPELQSKPEDSKNGTEEAVLGSPDFGVSGDEPNSDIAISASIQQSGNIGFHFDTSAPAVGGKEESHQHMSEPGDGKSDDQAVSSQIRHSLGESSFSAVGPVSSRINYSGPVPSSGSISLRSDSSTTSTRSFAFPVLQTEWNSSPVRMAKADRRHCRKHRGWRQGLLCCRF